MKQIILFLGMVGWCVGSFAEAAFPETRMVPSGPQGPVFVVDGKEIPASIYYANNQYGRDDLALEGMRKAYDAGYRVFSIQLLLPSLASTNDPFQTLEKFFDPFPDALILPRVWLGVSGKWYADHPGELYTFADGSKVADIASPVSEKWLAEAECQLGNLLDTIAQSKYARRFIGIIPTYYYTGEWHMWELQRSGGYSPLMETAFQQWLAQKYPTLGKLNAAWKTKYRRFDEIRLPSKEERYRGDFGIFRDPSTQQREIDFALFFNTRTPELMISIARTIKEKTGGHALVGYFYGYHFEHAWHNTWPQQSGHLGLSKLLDSPYVDFYGCSYSYNFFNRKLGFPVDFISPHDSAQLNGKAVFFEEDFYTHLALSPKENWAPGWQHRTKNIDETLAVLKRNMGVAMAHGEIMHWQDLLSDGRFNDKRVWDWYRKAADFRQTLEFDAPYAPQVAVLIDETYPIWQQVEARAAYGRWVYETRMMLSRVDVSMGYYLQSDLSRIPSSVRCVVLLTPYHLSDGQKQALKTRFMTGERVVVFCYLPDMFQERLAPALSGFSGIGFKLNDGAINPQSVLVPGTLLPAGCETVFGDNRDLSYIENHPEATLPDVSPYLTVDDPDATVFARYTDGGEPSCAWKLQGDWVSVYLGTHRLTPHIWREIFRRADCHLFLGEISDEFEAPDFVQASGNFLMVQSFSGGSKMIQLPEEADSVYCWRDGESQRVATNSAVVEMKLKPGVPDYIYWERK